MFRRRRGPDQSPDPSPDASPEQVYAGLRAMVLGLDASSVGVTDADGGPAPWGCVMDTGYPNGAATLVCLADGTTSLYTSAGFGIIGGGAHEQVARANAMLLEVLAEHVQHMAPETDPGLPAEGCSVIRALCEDGRRSYAAVDDDLGNGRSPLSPVFLAAHRVITELRLLEQSRH